MNPSDPSSPPCSMGTVLKYIGGATVLVLLIAFLAAPSSPPPPPHRRCGCGRVHYEQDQVTEWVARYGRKAESAAAPSSPFHQTAHRPSESEDGRPGVDRTREAPAPFVHPLQPAVPPTVIAGHDVRPSAYGPAVPAALFGPPGLAPSPWVRIGRA